MDETPLSIRGLRTGLARALRIAGIVLTWSAASTQAATIFVVPGGAGTRDGKSWFNGMDLSAALRTAATGDELWVKSGTYKPEGPGGDRFATFQLKNGVALYGGFDGTETERNQRVLRLAANATILSGDLNGDDGINFANVAENTHHVVTGSGTDATAILDGFMIIAGNANDAHEAVHGGGIYISDGSPTLSNITLRSNTAIAGGGIYISEGNPTLHKVNFIGNKATSDGGGVFCNNSSPTLSNVNFSGNSARFGGGMYNHSSNPTLINIIFNGNTASASGGGGMANYESSPTLTNVTFGGNAASYGGGIYNTSQSSPILRNCILWGNGINEIFNDATATATVSDSIVQGGYEGGQNVLDADPKFVSFIPMSTSNLRLKNGSPAIDAGNDAVTNPSLSGTDLAGHPRLIGAHVDMGAYEFLAPPDTPSILHVNAGVIGGNGTGDSWLDASSSLFFAIARAEASVGNATPVMEIWVAAGLYKPSSIGERTHTFRLRNELAIYGGFEGTESARILRNPDPATNRTTLSGDLESNDGPDFANYGENSHHVVTGSGTNATAILDGFKVIAGNADDGASDGGGFYNEGGSPTLTNIIFGGNKAAAHGGGVFNEDGSPTLTNVTFTGNMASGGRGGGMANFRSNPTLINAVFLGNGALHGGGMANVESFPTLTNCTFSGNSATAGDGIYNSSSSNPSLRNCILWANGRQEIFNYDSSIATVVDGIVQGGYGGGTNVLDVNPDFISPVSGPSPATGNLRVQPDSPAINAGNNDVTNPALPATDLDGAPRVLGARVDLGAYELIVPPLLPAGSLDLPAGGGIDDLETATGAVPGEGTFSGIGVRFEDGRYVFSSTNLAPGTRVPLVYTVMGPGGSSNRATVTVTVVGARLTLTGTGRFGVTRVGDSSRTRKMVVRNIGNQALSGMTIKTTGRYRHHFDLGKLSSGELAPGMQTSFGVKFRPRAPGRWRAVVQVAGEKVAPASLRLSGRGNAMVPAKPEQ